MQCCVRFCDGWFVLIFGRGGHLLFFIELMCIEIAKGRSGLCVDESEYG